MCYSDSQGVYCTVKIKHLPYHTIHSQTNHSLNVNFALRNVQCPSYSYEFPLHYALPMSVITLRQTAHSGRSLQNTSSTIYTSLALFWSYLFDEMSPCVVERAERPAYIPHLERRGTAHCGAFGWLIAVPRRRESFEEVCVNIHPCVCVCVSVCPYVVSVWAHSCCGTLTVKLLSEFVMRCRSVSGSDSTNQWNNSWWSMMDNIRKSLSLPLSLSWHQGLLVIYFTSPHPSLLLLSFFFSLKCTLDKNIWLCP